MQNTRPVNGRPKASGRHKSSFNPHAKQLRKDEAWMRENGIPDFETVEDTEARHQRLVSSFYKHGLDVLSKGFAACNASECQDTCQCDACYWKTRNRRLKAITSASRLLAEFDGPLCFVTLIRPEWQVASDRLYEFKLLDLRKRVQEQLREAGVDLAVGSFEVSFKRRLKGKPYWEGHVHLVCAGTGEGNLRDSLRVKPWAECARPLQIERAGNVTRLLGYCLKRFPQERREYRGSNGRKSSNNLPLKPKQLFDHDFWLAGIPAGSRTILVGARQNADGSIRRISSQAKRRIRRGSG